MLDDRNTEGIIQVVEVQSGSISNMKSHGHILICGIDVGHQDSVIIAPYNMP
jgi:hypothetical protein